MKNTFLISILLFIYILSFGQTHGWSVEPSEFGFNGSITAVVFMDSSEKTTGTLGAFVDGTCRGYIDGTLFPPTDQTVFMLMCYSNVASGEILSFKYYDPDEDVIYDITETVEFESDMTQGSAPSPFEFHIIQNNNPPELTNPIDDINLTEGFGSTSIELTNVFSDPDMDELILTPSSSDEEVVTVGLDGTTLTITEVGLGSCIITINASDGNDNIDEMFTVNISPPIIYFDNFGVTTDVYDYTQNWDDFIAPIVEPGYRVAEWSDLVDYYNDGGDLLTLFDGLGLTEYKNSASIKRNGQQHYSSTRGYFVSRHEHNLPSGYLAHENIDNYLLSLGSWSGNRKIMVYKDYTTDMVNTIHYDVKVYPIPTSGVVNIASNKTTIKNAIIKLTNTSGRLMKLVDIGDIHPSEPKLIDLQELSQGIYFLTISNKDMVKTVKVVVE